MFKKNGPMQSKYPRKTVNNIANKFAFVTRRPYCPGRPKKLCFTTQSLAIKTVGARLSEVKQSFFGLLGQYGRRVTKANGGALGGGEWPPLNPNKARAGVCQGVAWRDRLR